MSDTPVPNEHGLPQSVADVVVVRGARERNLRNINVNIPLGMLVVITGVSGSGKSSLAVRTLAAAGQRRVLDSLSPAFSRRVDRLDPPDVDFIANVPPPVLVRWEHADRTSDARTTVASLLDIERGFAEFFVRCGDIVCPQCQQVVRADTSDSIFDQLQSAASSGRALIAFPLGVEQRRRGPAALVQQGCVRAIVDGAMLDLTQVTQFPRSATGHVVVDRLVLGSRQRQRWTESLELAFREGHGRCTVFDEATESARGSTETIDQRPWRRHEFSRDPRCARCERVFPPKSTAFFDVFAASGMCAECRGLGFTTQSPSCPQCHGARYRSETLAIRIEEKSIAEILGQTPQAAAAWLATLPSGGLSDLLIAALNDRLKCLADLGLGHLSLDRLLSTLSAGEIRRVLLAAAISTDLAETLLVIEEPAAGLHPENVAAVIRALRRPLTRRQSVVVVEHDAAVVAAAEHVIEVGPAAGERGGEIMAQGTVDGVRSQAGTVTAQAWSAWRRPAEVRPARKLDDWIEIAGIRGRTLQNVTLRVPIGGLTVVTGVSGSGKTSLVMEALPAALRLLLDSHSAAHPVFSWDDCQAPYSLPCIAIPAMPLTTSSRSTVVTWLKAFDDIRQVFAETAEAQRRGWTASRFSYFSPEGLRCDKCLGRGRHAVDLAVLPDVVITCPECAGTRYRTEAAEARYRGLSIVDVLALTVAEAAQVFRNRLQLHQRLSILAQLGLDYLVLGQPSGDLSGGEAQRIRLASRLWTRASQPNVYVCDEPSAGIHPVDVTRLAHCCRQLADLGQTVILIDHQRGLMEVADWIIELGPGAGPDGGRIVACGRPAELMAGAKSHAAQILRGELPA